jgi:hypothetical protein
LERFEVFILDRDGRTESGFARYLEYVERNESRFPPGALGLVRSNWYYGFTDHRAPHDSRLESATMVEQPTDLSAPWSDRAVSLVIRLRGAYDDGEITLRYPRLFSCHLDSFAIDEGHRDWRYDELRLDDRGHLVHEIEWCGSRDTGRWLITSEDIEHRWLADDT